MEYQNLAQPWWQVGKPQMLVPLGGQLLSLYGMWDSTARLSYTAGAPEMKAGHVPARRLRAMREAHDGHRTPLFSEKGCSWNVSTGRHHTDSPCWKMQSHLQRGLRGESRNPVERARGLSLHQRDGDRCDWGLKTGWNSLALSVSFWS